MTRRLTVVIGLVVLATLVLAGLGTLAVATARARQTTEDELRRQAAAVADGVQELVPADGEATVARRARVLAAIGRVLELDDVEIAVVRNGRVVSGGLPDGLADRAELLALPDGAVVSGHRRGTVWAATAADITRNARAVVVFSRDADAGLGAGVRAFLLASVVTLALGILAAWLLGRWLTRRVRAVAATTHRIAAGDLTARLPEPAPGRDDELDDLARSVNRLAAGLERSRAVEQQFLLSVSHDLRTPLTSIRGWSEAIVDGTAEPARAAAVIRGEAGRLERLVGDLLDLAKLQARSFVLRPVPVDLSALVASAVAGFGPEADRRGIGLMATGEPGIVVVGDADRLAQVVANLVENALRHTRSVVRTTVAADRTTAVVTIDDDGPGIAPEDLPHVFERLYVARHQPDRSESSSGLGLAIVREIVEASGGTVEATTAPAGGARFVLRLPRSS